MQQYTDTDGRKWNIVARRWTTLERDADGNIVRQVNCIKVAPEGYPEAVFEPPPITEEFTPEQAAAIEAALNWQPKTTIDRLVRKEPKPIVKPKPIEVEPKK